ncbi:radical S-adenosyl methionine domain-containing protein 1, mitochondrial isoform X3 [Camelus dromedarius]|uniref:radical S-adenosyl methionine domain-containing protein 1, mitochondrial isoform X3 n=1 Tax=Camelus dromedarius TaxID=9838 RepID=UPI0031191C77
MAFLGARARCSAAAAAKVAQRRRLAEDARGPPSPPGSQRAVLYVHWPYCEKRCSYCNFNKYIPRGVDEAAVRRCLVTEAQTLLRLSGVRRVESVFFGGGTPSLASPHTVAAVLEAVAQATHLPADSEVTLEANPTSAPGSRLAAFRAAGVNRLSVGLQSLDDTELQLLGRTHSASDALQTLAEARRLFPGRVSVDLMLGLPAQQVGPWLGQLRELLRHCDDHVSLYQLSLERGTALFTQVQRGTLPAPDPELAAEMYQEGRAVLREAGFRQYEVSNFARNAGGSFGHGAAHRCGDHSPGGFGVRGRVWLCWTLCCWICCLSSKTPGGREPPPLCQEDNRLSPYPRTLLGDGIRTWSFGRCLGYEDEDLVNGISALVKETSENSLAPSTL